MGLHAWTDGDYKSDSTMSIWAYIDSWGLQKWLNNEQIGTHRLWNWLNSEYLWEDMDLMDYQGELVVN